PVYLVGQDDVPEDRPLDELEIAVLVQDLTAQDITGHQVRGKLYTFEIQAQNLGDGVDHQGLGQAGDPNEQGVPPGVDGKQDLLHHPVLSHDDPGDPFP